MTGIEKLFISGDLSDLVIKCKEDTHHVHKLVLCTQSKFFMSACTNGFKESTTGVIELPDDDPEIVRAALRFLYGLGYVEGIKDIPELILYTKLYIFGDKYDIPPLRTLASKKYDAAAKDNWSTEHFVASIKLIDASTLPSDGSMRDSVIKHSADHIDSIFECAGFAEMMSEAAEFSKGLALELGKPLAGKNPANPRYKCPYCRGMFSSRQHLTASGKQRIQFCPFCGCHGDNWTCWTFK